MIAHEYISRYHRDNNAVCFAYDIGVHVICLLLVLMLNTQLFDMLVFIRSCGRSLDVDEPIQISIYDHDYGMWEATVFSVHALIFLAR